MDAGFRDAQGNIAITARVDDVINVAGHRLSTGQLEEVTHMSPCHLSLKNKHNAHVASIVQW